MMPAPIEKGIYKSKHAHTNTLSLQHSLTRTHTLTLFLSQLGSEGAPDLLLLHLQSLVLLVSGLSHLLQHTFQLSDPLGLGIKQCLLFNRFSLQLRMGRLYLERTNKPL